MKNVRCEKCREILKPDRVVWLELSLTDGKYYDELPKDHESQGAFPFGKTCAKKELKETMNINLGDKVRFPLTKDNKDNHNCIGIVKNFINEYVVILKVVQVNNVELNENVQIPCPVSYLKKF